MSLSEMNKNDIIKTDLIKQEENVNVEETSVNLDYVKKELLDEEVLDEKSAVDVYKIDLKYENILEQGKYDNLSQHIEVDTVKMEDIENENRKTITTCKQFNCNKCGRNYEGYCQKCSTLSHILNNILPDLNSESDLNTTPTDILKIKDIANRKGVFALKTIPKNVTFGPFEGISAIESTNGISWKIRDGKFVNDANSNWMKYVCAANESSKNLDIFQFDEDLYFQTSREIQEDEELLIYYNEEIMQKLYREEDYYFVPVKKEEFLKIFACTLCCLGFRLQECLIEHKSKCPHVENKNDVEDFEIIECHCCKVWLEKQEHLEYHMQYCLEHYKRIHTYSSNSQQRNGNGAVINDKRITSHDGNPTSDVIFKSDDEINLRRAVYGRTFADGRQRKYKNTTNITKSKVRADKSSYIRKEVKSFECDICKKVFRKKHCLIRHTEDVHSNEKRYKCTNCRYQTNNKSDMNKHLNIHNDVKPYECDICKIRFPQKRYLKRHNDSRHCVTSKTEKNHKCPQCSYQTNHKSALVHHLNTHSDIKLFQCDICKERFGQKTSLTRHIKTIHLNTHVKFKCPECSYETNRKDHLKVHHFIHSEARKKDFKCSKCCYQTYYRSNLKQHLNTHDVKLHECHICKETFGRIGYLKRHMKSIHSDKQNANA